MKAPGALSQALHKVTTVTATLALVAACAATALAGPPALPAFAPDDAPPSSNAAGQRLMSAEGMAPGDTVRGALTIGNPRAEHARLDLAVTANDRPGRFGGRLSQRLRLVIRSGDGSVVYRGPLPEGDLPLGRLRPAERDRFSLAVTFPDGGRATAGGPGDNAHQGSSSSLKFSWRLS